MFQEPDAEGSEANVQRKIAGDGCQIPRTDDVHAVVPDVQAAGDTFEVCVVVAGGKDTADFNFVSQHRVAVVVGGVEDIHHFVGCVAREGADGGRDVGLGQKLRDVKFGLVHPFIADSVGGNVNGSRPNPGAKDGVGFVKTDAGFNHAQSQRGREKGDEEDGLAGSAEHKLWSQS